MENVKEILKFVRETEDYYYEHARKELEKGNALGHAIIVGQATAFQQVRYFIETMIEENQNV